MPEGDTIHYAAHRIRPILEGRVPDSIETPHRRFAKDHWPERLAGREVTSVDAYGKHLFLRFEGDLVIHSHLRMTGSWSTRLEGERHRRAPRRAWLRLRAAGHEVVQFDGPVLELMTGARARGDRRIAGLGPDILGPELDEERGLRRLREDDPTRTIGDALLDQRTVAGIGNIWKCEGCWEAQIDPWRRSAEVSDEEVVSILRATRPRMQETARQGMQAREYQAYSRARRRCRRCGEKILVKGQGDDNRRTFWCPGCQR